MAAARKATRKPAAKSAAKPGKAAAASRRVSAAKPSKPGRPKAGRAAPARSGRKAPKKRPAVVARTDEAAAALPKIRIQNRPDEVHRNKAAPRAFHEKDFEAFFQAEIEAELEREAEIFHDRIARWRCQCCDAVIPVPRRTTVFHGDFVLEHDDVQGLMVNGEKFVPLAHGTPIDVQQPGRLRNPFTGRRLEDEGYQPVDLS